MTRIKFHGYDASYKIAVCEEYLLRKKEIPTLKAKEFATEKGIKKSTFYDWIGSYEEYMKTSGDNNLIITSSKNEVKVPNLYQTL